MSALESANDSLDVHDLGPDDLLAMGRLYARCQKLAQAGSMIVAGAVEATGAHRREGHKSAADQLAHETGVSGGAAAATLTAAKKLRDRPKTEDELRRGNLSGAQAGVIASADADDEAELLDVAKRKGFKGLRDAAERLAQARLSEEDAMSRYRRAHADRHLRTWTKDGAFCGGFSMPLDEGARFMSSFADERERLFRQARRDGNEENPAAYAIDALLNTLLGVAPQPKRAKAALTLRADAAAVVRGHVLPGERCEVEGYGPIPVTVARSLLVDADIHGVVLEGDDVRAITSVKRHIPAKTRRGLEARDPTCSVGSCDQTKGLEIDHIWEFGKQGPTELDNLVRLCRGHHRMKTLLGWRITGPPGRRDWLPPEPTRPR
ncbi:MAG: HNH endonuclease [Actinobacteria bacterium]|nr:HNH endonuclease [Actinomycetota bacterium]